MWRAEMPGKWAFVKTSALTWPNIAKKATCLCLKGNNDARSRGGHACQQGKSSTNLPVIGEESDGVKWSNSLVQNHAHPYSLMCNLFSQTQLPGACMPGHLEHCVMVRLECYSLIGDPLSQCSCIGSAHVYCMGRGGPVNHCSGSQHWYYIAHSSCSQSRHLQFKS